MSASPQKEDQQSTSQELTDQHKDQEDNVDSQDKLDQHQDDTSQQPNESPTHQQQPDQQHLDQQQQQQQQQQIQQQQPHHHHNQSPGDNSAQTNDNREYSPTEDDIDIKEQDRFLPIANVARIMKKALPDNAKIAKEAKECVQECVSEFISFITSEASEKCQMEKRKTINGEDILYAMASLGFDNYAEALKIYLAKYRETTKIERASAINKDKEDGDEGESNEPFQQDSHQFPYPMQAYPEQSQ